MGASRPILAPAPTTEPIEIAGRDPVPVTLLTGFLGAGARIGLDAPMTYFLTQSGGTSMPRCASISRGLMVMPGQVWVCGRRAPSG